MRENLNAGISKQNLSELHYSVCLHLIYQGLLYINHIAQKTFKYFVIF